jgi:hypothetical protein
MLSCSAVSLSDTRFATYEPGGEGAGKREGEGKGGGGELPSGESGWRSSGDSAMMRGGKTPSHGHALPSMDEFLVSVIRSRCARTAGPPRRRARSGPRTRGAITRAAPRGAVDRPQRPLARCQRTRRCPRIRAEDDAAVVRDGDDRRLLAARVRGEGAQTERAGESYMEGQKVPRAALFRRMTRVTRWKKGEQTKTTVSGESASAAARCAASFPVPRGRAKPPPLAARAIWPLPRRTPLSTPAPAPMRTSLEIVSIVL